MQRRTFFAAAMFAGGTLVAPTPAPAQSLAGTATATRRGANVKNTEPASGYAPVNGLLMYHEIHGSGGQPDRAREIGPTTPMQRAGTAAEVAATIMWLLSAEASYTTGAIVDVGGGR